MKAQPLRQVTSDGRTLHEECAPHDATHLMIHTPGPFPTRMLPIILRGSRAGTGCWSWNGDTEKPTLKPSLRTRGVREITDDECDRLTRGEITWESLILPEIVCHTWITDGMVHFLIDSTHELAGQTLDLLDI